MTNYSNPRTEARIENWPHGKHRVTALFSIETKGGKERAVRITTGAPKKLTYAQKVRIVDGDDNRTYIIELTQYGHISVMKGDFKYQHESIFERDPRYAEIRALFEQPASLSLTEYAETEQAKTNAKSWDLGAILGIVRKSTSD